MSDIERFGTEIAAAGLKGFLAPSFDEAKTNNRIHNIVYLPNEETGRFDIYLTAKRDGVFGEYVCWTEQEFEEDEELLDTVIYAVKEMYASEDPGKRIAELNPNLRFQPYDNTN